MKPPGKTTLFRMQQAAYLEAERIEISQDGRVLAKLLKEPMPSQVALRDDFAGIVRLIDAIMSDSAILERLQKRLAAPSRVTPSDASDPIIGDAAIDAGSEVS